MRFLPEEEQRRLIAACFVLATLLVPLMRKAALPGAAPASADAH